ncbi:MAG TPA: N-carbamoylputrescine amidase [Bacilli bacterium]|nr:N-carbamoylputrescine amidase [Bacilli bacterium]
MIVKVAATQMSISWNIEDNLIKAEQMVRKAAQAGAKIILLQELFKTPYFCQIENYDYFKLAEEYPHSQLIARFQKIAQELDVVLPISFFEKDGNVFFNSLAMVDADGTILGKYRKAHIPTGQCYEEKFYFSPGDDDFKVFATKYGKVGIGICWDQWFPEVARILALQGAEIILYPTAIGSEPVLDKDSKDHWQHVMCGHAAANIIPVVASNRVGVEKEKGSAMTFFGSSFIADQYGNMVASMDRRSEGFITFEFDLQNINDQRISWGVFRDRRPDLYQRITKL